MSFDLAVWDGTAPAGDDAADAEFQRLYAAAGDGAEPTPAIRRYVEALLARYPDVTDLPEAEIDDSPWMTCPLLGAAAGPFMHFGIASAASDEAFAFILATAHAHGLVVFDPQEGRVVTVDA